MSPALMHWVSGPNPIKTWYASEICTQTQNQIWFIYLEGSPPPLDRLLYVSQAGLELTSLLIQHTDTQAKQTHA